MAVGIIAEYNPFHNGHLFHIENAKKISKNENCVVVMSGNFVQRGEPAVFNKHIRTKMALLNGADIVLELPVIFSTSSAEIFALGSVDLLNKTKIVKDICFGSEIGETVVFNQVLNILLNEPKQFKIILKNELDKGLSFPSARLNSISNLLNINLDFLKQPNNILALEYLKALKVLNSRINPITIKRKGTGFHSQKINKDIASATAIRTILKTSCLEKIKNCIPRNCYDLIFKMKPFKVPTIDDYSQILNYILRTKPKSYISEILDITEGLENKIIKNAKNILITDLIKQVKSKRYTYSKIQRAMLHIILDIKKSDIEKAKNNNINRYIRVLGFKRSKELVLKKMIKEATVPVLMNLKHKEKILSKESLEFLEKEAKTTDLYYINTNFDINREYVEPLVII